MVLKNPYKIMKKEIIVVIFIILTIIIAHITTQNYTNKIFDDILDELNIIEEKILNNSLEEDLKKDIENVEYNWNSKYKIFACFIEHDELEKVSTQIISIKANIEVENYRKSVDELEKCKFILKHIENKDSFNIVNIF